MSIVTVGTIVVVVKLWMLYRCLGQAAGLGTACGSREEEGGQAQAAQGSKKGSRTKRAAAAEVDEDAEEPQVLTCMIQQSMLQELLALQEN